MTIQTKTFAINSIIIAMVFIVCVVLSVNFGKAAVTQKYLLVRNGKPLCSILTGATAKPAEKHAAEELRLYLKKVSGAEVPVAPVDPLSIRLLPGIHENAFLRCLSDLLDKIRGKKQADIQAYPVFLATPESYPALKGSGLYPRVNKLSDEGFIIIADEKGLLIAGKKPMGVLYGVYTFLEDNLDIRWFFPGEEGEYCPKKATIEIGKLENIQNPAFMFRSLSLVNSYERAIDSWDWIVRNKMQLAVWDFSWKGFNTVVHNELQERGAKCEMSVLNMIYELDAQYFKEHPEYFGLIDGKRMPTRPKPGELYQPCTSNPDVIDIIARKIIVRFKSDKFPVDIVHLSNLDNGKWCECDRCRAQDDPQDPKFSPYSTRWARFENAVAMKVLKECPDKTLIQWGDPGCHWAPQVKPDPKVMIQITMHGRCFNHTYNDPACWNNAGNMELLKGWLKFGNVVGPYEYYACFIHEYTRNPPYVPEEDIVIGDIKWLWSAGAKYWIAEIAPPDAEYRHLDSNPPRSIKENWPANAPTYYLIARLLWNPDLDGENLKDDFYRKFYGSACLPMKAYRQLLSKTWQNPRIHMPYDSHPIDFERFLAQPGLEQKLLGYLAQAEKDAATGGDPKVRKRVARDKENFNLVWHAAYVDFLKSGMVNDVPARMREFPIKIDGVLDEADWSKADYTTGFFIKGDPNVTASSESQALVKILYDDSSIYLGIIAMEPSVPTMKVRYSKRDEPVWEDDNCEIFIDPDGSGKEYYHFAVNPKGTIWDAKCPGNDSSFNADCEAACRTLEDCWVLEMRIAAGPLGGKIITGGNWKINIVRVRKQADGTGEWSAWTIGKFASPSNYRTIVFGDKALIENGGFEKTKVLKTPGDLKWLGRSGWTYGNEPPLFPIGWALHNPGKMTIVSNEVHSGNYAWKIEKGSMHSGTFPALTGDKLNINFWAKGEGTTAIMLFQYAQTAEGKEQFLSTALVAVVPLVSEWKKYSFEFSIAAEKTTSACLAFDAKEELVLDDVVVTKTVSK
jgi:hypothetical protein